MIFAWELFVSLMSAWEIQLPHQRKRRSAPRNSMYFFFNKVRVALFCIATRPRCTNKRVPIPEWVYYHEIVFVGNRNHSITYKDVSTTKIKSPPSGWSCWNVSNGSNEVCRWITSFCACLLQENGWITSVFTPSLLQFVRIFRRAGPSPLHCPRSTYLSLRDLQDTPENLPGPRGELGIELIFLEKWRNAKYSYTS